MSDTHNPNNMERCFGRGAAQTCCVLKSKACVGYKNCAWYRPASEYKASVNESNERLRRLDEKAQTRIADKFFRGGMPWSENAPKPVLEPLALEEAAVLAFAVQSRIGRAPEDG